MKWCSPRSPGEGGALTLHLPCSGGAAGQHIGLALGTAEWRRGSLIGACWRPSTAIHTLVINTLKWVP